MAIKLLKQTFNQWDTHVILFNLKYHENTSFTEILRALQTENI